MPELPEVETAVRWLGPRLCGRTLLGARVAWARTLGGQRPAALNRAVAGRAVRGVSRRAKWIRIDLDDPAHPAPAVLVHLRMSGRLVIAPAGVPPGPHVRVSLLLAGGGRLDFVDARKFGRLRQVGDADAALADLGPEPLAPGFGGPQLGAALGGRRARLKPLLLDQRVVAGLGNIYTDEALFRARLDPRTPAAGLGPSALDALCAAIRAVLTEAIAAQGSSIDASYRTPAGEPGRFQERLAVYGRGGEPCPLCQTAIRRVLLAQRATHFCPRCQRRARARRR